MKAKEYFEKYDSLIMEDVKNGNQKNITQLVVELGKEVETLYESRNGKTVTALAACIREINQKWNAIANLFAKKYGDDILVYNGFLKFWLKNLPLLKDFL